MILTGIRLKTPRADLWSDYANEKTRKAQRPLYAQLADISTPDQAITSSKQFGAFYGELQSYDWNIQPWIRKHEQDPRTPFFVGFTVKQSFRTVLGEFAALRAILGLVAALEDIDAGTDNQKRDRYAQTAKYLSDLAGQTATWHIQRDTELAARWEYLLLPQDAGWTWTGESQRNLLSAGDYFSTLSDAPERQVHFEKAESLAPFSVICHALSTVLNSFPPMLRWSPQGIVQHPGADLLCGIRPLVYHMIREDLLARAEVRLCRHKSCKRFFRPDRRDQRCCGPECAASVRAQKYYLEKRKPKREEQRKKRTPASKGVKRRQRGTRKAG